MADENDLNVLGDFLAPCSTDPMTGFYRDDCCVTGPEDTGRHVVCAEATAEFLAFCRSHGNDLAMPSPKFGFPGLKPGDRWCLCAGRRKEAFEAGVAPPIVLRSTHEAALRYVELAELKKRALDLA